MYVYFDILDGFVGILNIVKENILQVLKIFDLLYFDVKEK